MGPLFILSGPSGSGKSTLIGRLLREAPWPLRLSVSVTTRSPRPGEQDGVHYRFWDRDRFLAELQRAGFLEWAEVYGNLYGTLKEEVHPFRVQGIGVLLDIDVKGWEQVKSQCPEAVSLFIRTSSPEILETRLRERKTDSEESIQRRLRGARDELTRASEYQYQVINDDLETALDSLRSLLGPFFRKGDLCSMN